VKVKEKLSSVSSAFDLNSWVVEVTVCGMSSSLRQVTVVPTFTVRRDKLVTTKFSNSITRGFAAVGEPHVAVCLLPGTEIAFDENVECEPSFGVGIFASKKIGQHLARFRQINMHNPVTHHDALEFPDGQVVLLSRLCEGQRATVLQLPAAASAEAAKERATPEVCEPSLLS
jgi:hypothetical protein